MRVIGRMAQYVLEDGSEPRSSCFRCLISTRVAPVRLESIVLMLFLPRNSDFAAEYCCEHEDRIEASRSKDLCRPCGEGRNHVEDHR